MKDVGSHGILKNVIASTLMNRGYTVEIEKRIYTPEDIAPCGCCWFSVDVYGERNGEVLMYEVGHCEQYKLDWLRKHIGKTIHVPFLTKWIPKSLMYESQRRKKWPPTQDQINGLDTPNISARRW